jgi:putative lipase involved disintegration of autophagic bodies
MDNVIVKCCLENVEYIKNVGTFKDENSISFCTYVIVTKENNFYAVWKSSNKTNSNSLVNNNELITIGINKEEILEYAIDLKNELILEYKKDKNNE